MQPQKLRGGRGLTVVATVMQRPATVDRRSPQTIGAHGCGSEFSGVDGRR